MYFAYSLKKKQQGKDYYLESPIFDRRKPVLVS